jgi:predicted nucleic acid-binding protein
MNKPVLLDNTVLSNLAQVDQMELVFRLWPERVMTTHEVWREYEVAAQAGKLPSRAWNDLTITEMMPQEMVSAAALTSRLGAGERSCLAVAQARQGLLASDDADIRHVARRLGIPVSGTLGILVLAVRQQLLSLERANALLADMILTGYRSPLEKLDILI